MGDQQTVPVQPTAPQDDLRWRYDKALELLQSHHQTGWLKNTAFILAHAIILGGIGNIVANVNNDQVRSRWVVGLAILGFLVGLLWLALSKYNYAFYRLRVLQAREIEEKNPNLIDLLTQGRRLHRNGKVMVSLEEVQLGRMWRCLGEVWPVQLMIYLFLLAYAILMSCRMWKLLSF